MTVKGGKLRVPPKSDEPKVGMGNRNFNAWVIILSVAAAISIFMYLFVTIVQGDQQRAEQRTQIEKVRADTLQRSVDSLRSRADEETNFFELVRQLITTQNVEQKKALLNELQKFSFHPPATLSERSPPGSTTSTTRKPSSTRAPPSSTTTTSTTRPMSPPPTTCVRTPAVQLCR